MSAPGRQTLDDEGWCVRCGAPSYHYICPDVADDGHWWVEPGIGINHGEYTFCMKCGNIRRADGKPSSACRGPGRVALRASGVASVEPGDADRHTDQTGNPDADR